MEDQEKRLQPYYFFGAKHFNISSETQIASATGCLKVLHCPSNSIVQSIYSGFKNIDPNKLTSFFSVSLFCFLFFVENKNPCKMERNVLIS